MDQNLKVQIDLYRFFLQYKLNGIIRFYNESKRLVSNEVVYLDKKIEDGIHKQDRRMLLSQKDECLGWFREMLIHNCFLMIHSQLEESLSILLRAFGAEQTACKGSDIGRFKESYQEKHGLRICDSQKWGFLTNCSKIRHLILHANGNISLARDPEDAMETCGRLGSRVEIRKPQIVLQEKILQEFAEAVSVTIEWVFHEMEKTKV